MPKKVKIVSILAVSFCLLFFIFRSFSEPKDIYSAETLYNFYASNEIEANKKFKDKKIEIEGTVKNISKLNNKLTFFLKTNHKSSTILCELKDAEIQEASQIQINDFITISGTCKGFLKDVIVLECKLIKHKK